MAEYICREAIIKAIDNNFAKLDIDVCNPPYYYGANDEYADVRLIIHKQPAADVQPVKKSKWCPPLMGQGKCDTYCERCHGKIMRNSTGIFEETPFCPHCGARMDKS